MVLLFKISQNIEAMSWIYLIKGVDLWDLYW